MSNDEGLIRRVQEYWPIVEDIFLDYDIWEQICIQFSKYEAVEKQFIPFDICELIEASKKIGCEDPKLSGIQLIILISIIEALSLRVKYITFPKWYKDNYEEQQNKKCLSSFQDYNEIHGTGRYFRTFFNKIEKEDKLNAIIKILKKYDDETFAPFCYQSKDECFDPYVYWKINDNNILRRHILSYPRECRAEYSRSECPAMKDEKILKEGMEKFSHHLQEMRNKFIHESILPIKFLFEPPYTVNEKSRTIKYSALLYTMKNEDMDKIEIFDTTLTPEYLYKLVTKYLLILFHDYLEEVKY